ncbi:MAG: hypothetical protein ACR2NP_09595, partial [Pirellulaceae bacterium]
GREKPGLVDVLNWLKDEKRISSYQMRVLARGVAGPFRFENYRVHARESTGPLAGSFRGRHIPTDHPVRLFFFGGESIEDARQWATIRESVMQLPDVDSPFVTAFHEWVEIDGYRFAVTADKPGQTLHQKLPRKGRLPWPQTCQAGEQLALGLQEVHRFGIVHGRIWPGAIWLLRGGNCQLTWQIPGLHYCREDNSDDAITAKMFQSPVRRVDGRRRDLFSLGAVMFRLVTGKPPNLRATELADRDKEIAKAMQACDKYELPDAVRHLLQLLMTADVSDELKDAEVTAKLIAAILETQSIAADIEADPPTLKAYRQSLEQKNRSTQFFESLESINGDTTAVAASESSSGGFDFASRNPQESTISPTERLSQRKKSDASRSWVPLVIGASILLAAGLLGALLGGVFTGSNDSAISDASGQSANNEPDSPESKEAEPGSDPDAPIASTDPAAFRPQNVVADDGVLPWESPTSAEPIDMRFIPPAPQMLFTFRPARLTGDVQAARLLRAMGPEFESLRSRFESLTGLKAEEIDRLTVSLHVGQPGQLATFAVAELEQPMPRAALLARMGEPESARHSDAETILFTLTGAVAWLDPPEGDSVTRVVVGDEDLINQSLTGSGLSVAGRSMSQLIDRSDRDRDLNVLFLTNALLSEEATRLFTGRFAEFRRTLFLFFDDRMQGVMLSLHFDRGNYFEMITAQSPDLPDSELMEWLPQRFRSTRDALTGYVSQMPPHPFWSSVQQRFDNMIGELVSQLRVGRERRGVITNCWLPPMAAHNLVAAGELVLSGPRLATATGPPASNVPATLQALLDKPRSISVTSDPDLINLLQQIETEVRDEYPTLPFEFHIRLFGNDLAEEGITQNQRPGQLVVDNQPLSDILTKIMLQANPDKSATSPADENCKLVWLVDDDPESPGNVVVLVTTRKAARARNQTLPQVFQPE